jgi:hypothetical protein
MMPVFVGSGAGVGRAGKRKQRHNSKGSNLHDHLLQMEKVKRSWRRLVQSVGALARAFVKDLAAYFIGNGLLVCRFPN